MKIEIELDDQGYCDGCPILLRCTGECLLYDIRIDHLVNSEKEDGWITHPRPQKCIDDCGE